MKKLYWQSHFLPRSFMIVMCIFSLLAVAIVEYHQLLTPEKYYREKLAAALLTNSSMEAVKKYRLSLGVPIDHFADPQKSGLIGAPITQITSDHGNLDSKRTSINPNLSALVVTWLKEINLKKGDKVAIGLTGSFPALNIAVLSAIKTLKLKPVIIVSAGASQWGANIPGLSWINIQHYLYQKRLLPYKPTAASLGGIEDRAWGLSKAGKNILRSAIDEYHIPFIDSKNAKDAISKRMKIYAQYESKNSRIKAYINIGGGTASLGKNNTRKRTLKSGLITSLPVTALSDESVTTTFLKRGVPVINLANVDHLAKQYGFPESPQDKQMVGYGSLFFHKTYNIYLATGALAVIILFLVIVSIAKKKLFIYTMKFYDFENKDT